MGGQSSRTPVHLAGPPFTDAERRLNAPLAARLAHPVAEAVATLRALAPPAARAPDRTPP